MDTGLSAGRMDVIDTLVQENKAFADELEEQIIQGQVMEKMLAKAHKIIGENVQEIQGLKQQLSLKDRIFDKADISMMEKQLEGSTQVKIRGLVTLGSQVEELKQTGEESQQGLENTNADGERERDAEVDILKREIRILKEERSHLQALGPNSDDGNTLLKDSFSQSQAEINRLQSEIQDLQGLQLTNSHTELQSVHLVLNAQEESQPGTEDSAVLTHSLPESESHLRRLQAERYRSPSSSCGTLQRRAEKQRLSGANTPEDCLSARSFDTRFSGYHSSTWRGSPSGRNGAHRSLQRNISEAQVLVTEMDTYVKDCFHIQLQEDSVTMAVIESLVQQNQAIGQELGMQIMRLYEMEEMLSEADEQKAIMMSENQLAIEELQEFISAKDKLLKELTEDYSQLKEKSRLQNLFYETEQGKKLPKESFHQSQPEINKLKGERQGFQRKRLTNSHPELQSLHMERKAPEESQPRPEDSSSVAPDLDGFRLFLGAKQDKKQQNTLKQTGPGPAGGATHPGTEYMTNSVKV